MTEQAPSSQEQRSVISAAVALKEKHDVHVARRDDAKYAEKYNTELRDENLKEAGRIAIGQAPNTPVYREGVFRIDDPSNGLEGRLAEIKQSDGNYARDIDKASRDAQREEFGRYDTVGDARSHLDQNREVYEQAAINDATARGHEINFGGQHYSAQPPEVPKQ